jgi:hypothetical protein
MVMEFTEIPLRRNQLSASNANLTHWTSRRILAASIAEPQDLSDIVALVGSWTEQRADQRSQLLLSRQPQ